MVNFSIKAAATAALFALPLVAAAPQAKAANIVETWDLFSHPDGNQAPPVYGLRLDGLFTGNSGDVWTFEFEDGSGNSTISMNRFDDGSVQIKGTVFGGRQSGAGYQAGNVGNWLVDFTFRDSVFFGDENPIVIEVPKGGSNNNGFIAPLFDVDATGIDETLSNGTSIGDFEASLSQLTIALIDSGMQPAYTFLYANDDHRCGSDPDCLSRTVGRGWVDHAIDYDGNIDPHIASSDWLFTGQVSQVPVPAALPLLATAFGLLGIVTARRRKAAA